MKYIYPDYYDKFQCIADRCPCTCCAGWAIEIDDASLTKYRQMKLNSVDYSEGCFLQDGSKDKRCSNLCDNGLCRLILEHGEDILCDTCRMFPRHVEEYEGVREYSLSISCPVVSSMLLTRTEPVSYLKREDSASDPEEYDEYEQSVYEELSELRWELLKLLNRVDIPLSERCRRLLTRVSDFQNQLDDVAEAAHKKPDAEAIFRFMEQWEFTNEDFPTLLSKSAKRLFANKGFGKTDPLSLLDDGLLSGRLCRIIEYFLYTYLCGSVYDAYYYGMAQLCIGAAIHIKLLCDAHRMATGSLSDSDVERFTYLYARELEHSIPNVLKTEAWMEENRII